MAIETGFLIDRHEQLEALSAPARQEIVDTLVVAGPCSVAELGRQTGRAADSLYYHLKKLLAVGVVIEANVEGEATFDVPGRPFGVSHRFLATKGRAGLLKMAGGLLRLTERNIKGALENDRLDVEHRNFVVGRSQGWLTRDEVDEVLALVERITQRVVEQRNPGHGERYALTMALLPLGEGKQ